MTKVKLTKRSNGYGLGDRVIPFCYFLQLSNPRPDHLVLKFTKGKPKAGRAVCFTENKGLLLTNGEACLQSSLLHRLVWEAFAEHEVKKIYLQIKEK